MQHCREGQCLRHVCHEGNEQCLALVQSVRGLNGLFTAAVTVVVIPLLMVCEPVHVVHIASCAVFAAGHQRSSSDTLRGT